MSKNYSIRLVSSYAEPTEGVDSLSKTDLECIIHPLNLIQYMSKLVEAELIVSYFNIQFGNSNKFINSIFYLRQRLTTYFLKQNIKASSEQSKMKALFSYDFDYKNFLKTFFIEFINSGDILGIVNQHEKSSFCHQPVVSKNKKSYYIHRPTANQYEFFFDRVTEVVYALTAWENYSIVDGMYCTPNTNLNNEPGLIRNTKGEVISEADLGLTELDPEKVTIRTMQVTPKQKGATLEKLVLSMEENGFLIEPEQLIDVVRMPDGMLSSLDTTRIVAAQIAKVKIKARIHNHDDPLPDDDDFLKRFLNRNGDAPKTFGDAANNRIRKQGRIYRDNFPMGSLVIASAHIPRSKHDR